MNLLKFMAFTSIHYGTRNSFIVVHVSTFFVLGFPSMVYLEATMKFYSTSLLQKFYYCTTLIQLNNNYIELRFTSRSSISQEVLIVSLSSEYFHFDKSYLLDGCSKLVVLLFDKNVFIFALWYFFILIISFFIILTLSRY